jgi:nucleotide-binding universal stress UspA family protein
MTYTSIMTHVQSGPEAAPRLACAVALARRFGAQLIGVGAEMIPPLAFDNGYYSVDAEWVVAMRGSIDQQLVQSRDIFRRETAGFAEGDARWLSGIESPTPALAAASRAADLLVAGGGRLRHSSPYRDVSAAELAMQAGRPVLVVPPGAAELSGRKVLVAWKDVREARRALADALPFLKAAEGVRILEICEAESDEDGRSRTEEVAAGLRRHGATVETKVIPPAHEAAGKHILDEAKIFGADLIVLGCYGHSRLGEWVFGGVTRDVLAQNEAYLLLSH